jgi:hypothetical protein
MAILDPANTLVPEAAARPLKVELDARGGGSPHLLRAHTVDVNPIHGDAGVTLAPTGPTIGGCSVDAGGRRTGSEGRPAGDRRTTDSRLTGEAGEPGRLDARSPAVVVTCRTIVPLVAVRFTWLSVPRAAEGIRAAAVVVVSFARLRVSGVAEGIGPAEGAVGPAVWLTG